MKKTKYLALLCAVTCLVTALVVPAFGATNDDLTGQMANNSAAWYIAQQAGDTAASNNLANANQNLANQLAGSNGSANYNSSAGTWNITTGDGSVIQSSGVQDGHQNISSYTTTGADGSISQSTGSSYTSESIDAYMAAGGTTQGLTNAYNASAAELNATGAYGSESKNASAAGEVAVIQEVMGLSDSEANKLQSDLEELKQEFNAAQAKRDEAVRNGDTEAAAAYKEEMMALHEEAEEIRSGYGYTTSVNGSTNGTYIAPTTTTPTPTPTVNKRPTYIRPNVYIPVVQTYTISASASSGGSISPSGTISVSRGDSKSFSITPATGYQIQSVVVNGSNVGAVNIYTFANITSSSSISATFVKKTYSITAAATTGGSISPAGTSTVEYGGSKTYTIMPATGYNLQSVVVDGVDKGALSSYTFSNITGGHSISATFVKKTYTITIPASTGGTVSPSGTISVEYGSSKTFTFTPDWGYEVKSVVVDGVNKGAVSSYTLSNITGPHTINVVFEPNGYVAMGNSTVTNGAGTALNNGGNSIKSGYGITSTTAVSYEFVTDLRIVMTYDFGDGAKTVVLEEIRPGEFAFPVNAASPTGQRCVYIPVDTPDGTYTLTYTISGKNAAGEPLSDYRTTTITVRGNMYEDDATGDS